MTVHVRVSTVILIWYCCPSLCSLLAFLASLAKQIQNTEFLSLYYSHTQTFSSSQNQVQIQPGFQSPLQYINSLLSHLLAAHLSYQLSLAVLFPFPQVGLVSCFCTQTGTCCCISFSLPMHIRRVIRNSALILLPPESFPSLSHSEVNPPFFKGISS